MKQLTARTIEDAIRWIEGTPHHVAERDDDRSFFILRGRTHKLRIPSAIHARMKGLMGPGGEFDTRMYRATEAGLALLAAADAARRAAGEHAP